MVRKLKLSSPPCPQSAKLQNCQGAQCQESLQLEESCKLQMDASASEGLDSIRTVESAYVTSNPAHQETSLWCDLRWLELVRLDLHPIHLVRFQIRFPSWVEPIVTTNETAGFQPRVEPNLFRFRLKSEYVDELGASKLGTLIHFRVFFGLLLTIITQFFDHIQSKLHISHFYLYNFLILNLRPWNCQADQSYHKIHMA